jgi:hypothetical protein
MSVRDSGWQPDHLAAALDHVDALLDQAAQAHAEALVDAAKDYGHIHPERTITKTGEGQRTITDPGKQMVWLAGKRVPLRGVTDAGGKQAIRTVSAASLAAGRWWYPGREQPMADADQDPRVRAVVAEWQERLMAGRE